MPFIRQEEGPASEKARLAILKKVVIWGNCRERQKLRVIQRDGSKNKRTNDVLQQPVSINAERC